MGMSTLTTVEQSLRSFYLPGLRYQLNDKASAFLAQVEKGSESVVGKDIIMALRYGRVGGIGNRADDGTLPTANARKTKQAKWETKNLFSRFQITDKTVKASKSNVGAFANMLEMEIADCENDAKLDLSRQALGDGTGKLTTLTSTSTYAAGPPKILGFTVGSTMYLAEGMLVDAYAANNTLIATAVAMEILLVDDATLHVHIEVPSDLNASITTGAYLVVSGNYGIELTGVAAVMGAATLYGIAKADYPWLTPQLRALGGEISENAMQALIDQCETRSGSKINFMQGSLGVRRAYIDYLSANKQISNTLDLKGGWTALSYNGIPFVGDKYVPASTLDLLDLSDWAMYQMTDYEWLDEDGAMLSRVANKAAWEASLVKYCDIGCQRPRGQARMTTITEH